jgi:pimeloyl-ACP methyl ester carboxylesterase
VLPCIPLRPESPRYAASLLFLPDLWAPAGVWQPVAGFLGHRGWEGGLVEMRGRGGVADRAAALVEHVRTLAHPPVLIGHGAGGLVALAVADAMPLAAVILVAPLVPGSTPCRRLTARWEAVWAIARGRAVPPPRGEHARRVYREVPDDLGDEAAQAVLDVARGRWTAPSRLSVPALLVAGRDDPLLPREAAVALASTLGADHVEIPDAGHWPLLPPGWRSTVGVVHRWLVRRLGEPLLEFYADAMAEREDDG